MKKCFILQLMLLMCSYVFAQSDMLTLSLKLVKPHGIVDDFAYFEITLFNKTLDTTFIVARASDASIGMGSNKNSFLIPEVKLENGQFIKNREQGFFYFLYLDKSCLKILPKQTYVHKLAISIAKDGYTGMLMKNQTNVSKVRVRLDKLKLLGEKNGRPETLISDLTLYSNWLDVSNEDFGTVLRQ